MNNEQRNIPVEAATQQPPRTWYVEVEGKRVGPIPASQVLKRIADGELNRDSLAWYTGAADWQPLAATEFGAQFAGSPPPLTGKAVSNGLVWTLAFMPLIGAFVAGFFAGVAQLPMADFWWVTLVLNIVVSLMDERKLKAAGHDTKKMGSAWLVPVYLFKRARVLKQGQGPFVVWMVCFFVSLLTV